MKKTKNEIKYEPEHIYGIGNVKMWEEATQNLAMAFVARYWKEYPEVWWVAEDIGGVLFVNDYFFSIQNIVEFMKYDYSPKMMFEWMDYSLERYSAGDNPICIRDYKKLRKPNGKNKTTRKVKKVAKNGRRGVHARTGR